MFEETRKHIRAMIGSQVESRDNGDGDLKMYLLRTLMIVTCMSWSASAFAAQAFFTGDDLLHHCNGSRDGERVLVGEDYYYALGVCVGYVMGVTDMLSMSGTICGAQHVSASQMGDIVIKYLHNHPETRHYSASDEVEAALKNAFLCRR